MFYILRSLSLNKHCYAWDNLSFIDWKRVICEKCGRPVSTAQMDEGCLKLELDGGSAYPDLLQFTGAGPRLFLLSGRALDAFTENGITGIAKAEQVSLSWISTKAKRAVSSPIPTYYSIDIDGRIDYCFKAMFLKKKNLCDRCGQFDWNRERQPAITLDESTWTGNDLCRISSAPGFEICTQKFVDVVKSYKLTGFECTPVDTFPPD